MSHIQFTRDGRIELAALLRANKTQVECAKQLGMHRSSVCRELKINTDADGVYRGGSAHRKHLMRKKNAKKSVHKIRGELREYVIRKLKQFWSPEQIAGRLEKDRDAPISCHETIYKFVYKERPDLVKYLRRQKSKYRKKRGTVARIARNSAMEIRSINDRSTEVATRERFGDWEDDTVIGAEKTQHLLTAVERKSGFGKADKLEIVTAEIVQEKSIMRFRKLPRKARRTLTRDNGSEFGDYDHDLERVARMEAYRANAYHSWERGVNENWNGLLRQFFPKGTFFAAITQAEVDGAVTLINNRPRKRLGYATPREVFRDCCNSK